MDRLPRETLGRILELSTKVDSYESWHGAYTRNANVSSVCRHLREIATSHEPLWSTVLVEFANTWPPLPLIELYLQRSGTLPLHLTLGRMDFDLRKKPASEELQAAYLTHVLPLLCAQVQRWKSLSVGQTIICQAPILQFIQAIPFMNASLLEDVKLYLEDDPDEEGKAISVIGRAPAIKRLKWHSINETGEPAHPNFPWHRLIHLDIAPFLTWRHTFAFVARCTSAITLKIECRLALGGLPRAPVTFHSLRALHLDSTAEAFGVLSRFNCPQLEILVLEIEKWAPESSWKKITTALKELNSPLKFLKIDAPRMPNSLLPKIFVVPRLAGYSTVQISTSRDEEWNEVTQTKLERAVERHLSNKLGLWKLSSGHTLSAGWIDVPGVRALQRRPEFENVQIRMLQELTDEPIRRDFFWPFR
ncbi:hypothetical protein NP233_g7793 [Leucocoprinus birnbaumii]|uniref:F-box domain-containing protein n=1 Tax=Leucocoprinus birnbaumii TaxID=56174 RepID=A0AAD5YPM0_9AGAR|nr:hypothetical protein NP233_g7793 [Leucocoprinus birnbaumii]